MIFDIVSWSVATLIWALSQNFWYFVLAAVFNSFQKVPNTAWYCLLVEDTHPKDRSAIFSLLQLINIIGGFFAPIGGLIVQHYALVPGVRIMYAIACVSMTIMFIGRNYATHETEIGIRKRQESAGVSYSDSLRQYADVIREVFANKSLLLMFGVYISFNFQMTVRGTYLSIYLVNALHFSAGEIAIFPAIASIAMLVLLVWVLPKMKEEFAHRSMIWGFTVSVIANIILVLSPAHDVTWVVVSTLLAAAGTIIATPFLEAAIANAIDDEHRANVMAILTVLILVCISPSGIIGGWTYMIDPRIPMMLVVFSFLLCIALMVVFIRKKTLETHNEGREFSLQSEI